MRRTTVWAIAACLVFVVAPVPAAGGPGLVIEPAYYEGREVGLLVPSGSSQNPHQVIGGNGCFPLGPELSGTGREKTATLYALFVPGATQYGDGCPDGVSRVHDHVITAAPGHPEYSAAWTVIVVRPGPAFSLIDMPYTREAEILAGIATGKLVATPTGFSFRAPVVGVS